MIKVILCDNITIKIKKNKKTKKIESNKSGM